MKMLQKMRLLEEQEAPAGVAVHEPEPEPARDGLRILVVDDNADAAEMLQAVLEMSGHAVAVAYDGTAALARAASFRPDAVFLDIGLPDRSGFEVAQALRRIHARAMHVEELVA